MLRLFIFFFLLLGIGLTFQLTLFMQEFKPGLRQGSEEALVDSAQLLAEFISTDFAHDTLEYDEINQAFRRYQDRQFVANIWGKSKQKNNLLIYITDHKGKVIYHSDSTQIGKDYSRWNDVYKTLNGEYGARSTEDIKGDPLTTRMYVAAPILVENEISGVLTLGKANLSLEPFIIQAQQKIMKDGAYIIVAALSIGFFMSFWLARSIRKLSRYAKSVSQGKNTNLPEFIDLELTELAQSMAKMRHQLDGKAYVEEYIHSLTHEMKSPIAAIKGASELLEQPMDKDDQLHFIHNIQNQSNRLEDIINQLLSLAALENRSDLQETAPINVFDLIEEIKQDVSLSLSEKSLTLAVEGRLTLIGESFLIRQAILNLVHNAIDFSPKKGRILISLYENQMNKVIEIEDEGEGIPDFAKDKIFERFYSLPRPSDNPKYAGQKSSGLGLSFVRQICYLHQGECLLENKHLPDSGVKAKLLFPNHI